MGHRNSRVDHAFKAPPPMSVSPVPRPLSEKAYLQMTQAAPDRHSRWWPGIESYGPRVATKSHPTHCSLEVYTFKATTSCGQSKRYKLKRRSEYFFFLVSVINSQGICSNVIYNNLPRPKKTKRTKQRLPSIPDAKENGQ